MKTVAETLAAAGVKPIYGLASTAGFLLLLMTLPCKRYSGRVAVGETLPRRVARGRVCSA